MKSCPICGSISYVYKSGDKWIASCILERCGFDLGQFTTKTDAIKVWNAQKLYLWIIGKLYPNFECEDCISMIQHGCQCDYYGAIAPGTPPSKLIVILRKIYKWLNTKKGTTF